MHWIQHIKRQVVKFAQREVNLIYPPQCACCREEFEETQHAFELCRKCQKRLIPRIWTPCPRCGGLVSGIYTPPEGCSLCRDTQFHFETVVALGGYHTELKHVVLRMKRKSGAALALAMGKQLARERREMLEKLRPELVIPVPMHWSHRIWRGINNPELVACELGKTLGIPFRRWLLVRCKKTLTQSTLPPRQRFQNVRGSFRVRFERNIRGRRILLVDDVLTTGATCSEAARMLKQVGAAAVAVAVIARAQGEPK